jgi:hypothetical protein
MIKEIYLDNITSHVVNYPATRPDTTVTQSTITFTGFDLSELAPIFYKKLDLLFYNRVCTLGNVLSSLVFISNPLELDDMYEKVYDTKTLYLNTDTERAMGIDKDMTDYTYFNTFWNSNRFFLPSISPFSDFAIPVMPVNGYPSVKIQKYGIAFDGWYTIMSVAVRVIAVGTPANAPVKKNLLGYHTFTEVGPKLSILLADSPSQPYSDLNWSDYGHFLTNGTTNPDGSVLVKGSSLGSIVTTLSVDNPFIKQEIFILPTYQQLYDNAVIQYAENPTYGNPFPTLRNKHRVIHNYAKDSSYVEAQYLLQTTDYLRAVTHV